MNSRPKRKRRRYSRAQELRSQALRDWLGCDQALDLDDNVTAAAAAVEQLLKEHGFSSGIDEQELKSSWRRVAGPMISQQTSVESLRNGLLMLNVLQPAVRYHLEQTKGLLLEKLQSEFGKETIRSIRFLHG